MQSPRALIVEDDARTRDWLAACVRTAFPGAEVVTAATVAAARDVLTTYSPELALLAARRSPRAASHAASRVSKWLFRRTLTLSHITKLGIPEIVY